MIARNLRRRGNAPAPLLLLLAFSVAALGEAPSYSIDTLYGLPSLDGTPPVAPTWSSDGDALAFLWNPGGTSDRDLWVHEGESAAPLRISDFASRGLGHGVTEVAWRHPSVGGLFLIAGGELYGAAPDAAPKKVFSAGSALQQLSVAPDGSRVAFVGGGPIGANMFEFEGDGSLWVGDARGDTPEPVKRVSTDAEAVFVESYQWSPDSSRIAFVVTDRSVITERVIHYNADGEAQARRVRRAFPGEPTTQRRVGVLDVATGSVRWLPRQDDERPIWGYGLSSDGSRLFVSESDFLIKEHVIDVYDLDDGERRRVYSHVEPLKTLPAWQVAWAPADDGLLILTDRGGYHHVYHQPEVGELRQVTSGNWEIASFASDPASETLYYVANAAHPAERHLYKQSLRGGEPTRLSQRAGTHEPSYAPDFSRIAVRFSNDTTPWDLYLNELDGDPARRLTDSPLTALADYELATVSYPRFESHVDGRPLIGRLLKPKDFNPERRYPLVVGSVYPNTVRNAWGGGSALPIWGLDLHLVESGFLVLTVDVRGSWGHGAEFRQDLHDDYGGIDKDDLASGVLHLIDAGFVDPERVGMWGWSYGGLMTLMSLSKYPDLYAVGVADAPATNVAHAFPEQMWVMGRPEGEDFPARYERMSVLYQQSTIEDPFLILHGTADSVVMYADSIALMEKLMGRGQMFEFVPMPGSTHIWANYSNEWQRYGYRKITEFLRQHLQPANR